MCGEDRPVVGNRARDGRVEPPPAPEDRRMPPGRLCESGVIAPLADVRRLLPIAELVVSLHWESFANSVRTVWVTFRGQRAVGLYGGQTAPGQHPGRRSSSTNEGTPVRCVPCGPIRRTYDTCHLAGRRAFSAARETPPGDTLLPRGRCAPTASTITRQTTTGRCGSAQTPSARRSVGVPRAIRSS
jgi:hypothetical protein